MEQQPEVPRVPWEWWDAIIVYFLWLFVGVAASVGVRQLFADPESDQATTVAVLVSIVLLIGITVAWIRVRGREKGDPHAIKLAFGAKRPTSQDVVWGIGFGVAAFVVVQLGLGNAITWLVDVLGREIPPVQESLQSAVQSEGSLPVILVLGVVLLGPFSEELLYRGVLYQGLAKHLSAWPAIGFSALAFGLTHFEPLVIVLTFPLGMMLAWLFRRRETLVAPVLAHAVFNLISFVGIRYDIPFIG